MLKPFSFISLRFQETVLAADFNFLILDPRAGAIESKSSRASSNLGDFLSACSAIVIKAFLTPAITAP